MDITALDTLQGELERLFTLKEMMQLTSDVLGFEPGTIGGTDNSDTFARALVGYCSEKEALPALVDAILLSAEHADPELRHSVSNVQNGELKPGFQIGDLRVVKKLGEGGLSIVYLAERVGGLGSPSDQAAVKVIRHEYALDRAAVQRYTTAARFLQRVQSQGLVPIRGVGQLPDQRPWIAAAYLQGQTLADRVRRGGNLHMTEAKPLLNEILEGLQALHARGLVHGDVKVENVFLVRSDSDRETHAVLMDACSDRLLFQRQAHQVSRTGVLPVLGTAKAISPEQARGREPDARSDIYAFGTLMYEVLTGRPPFVGDSAIDVIAGHLGSTPEAPSKHARKGWISEALDQVVLKALAKDPEQRFADVQALAEALEDAQQRPGKIKPLDESAFGEMRAKLLANASDQAAADALEQLGAESQAYQRVADAFLEAVQRTDDGVARQQLLLRAGRIYEHELRDPLRAEAVYQRVLEQDEENDAAWAGVEKARRASKNHAGLVEVLLERLERVASDKERAALLLEAANIYEKHLSDLENAAFAYTQVLVMTPDDEDARRGLRRVASNREAIWQEALTSLAETAQELVERLATSEDDERAQLQNAVAEAEAHAEEYRAHMSAVLDARREELAQTAALRQQEAEQRRLEAEQRRADAVARREELAQMREQARAERANQRQAELDTMAADVATLQSHREELAARAEELSTQLLEAQEAAESLASQVDEQTQALTDAQNHAESKVEAYEALGAEAGETPTEEQTEGLNKLAEEAEQAVNDAVAIEQSLTAVTSDLAAAQEQAGLIDVELQDLQTQLASTYESLTQLQAELETRTNTEEEVEEEPASELDDADLEEESEADEALEEIDLEPTLTEEEQQALDGAEAHLDSVRKALEDFDEHVGKDREARLQQDRTNAVELYLLLGEIYDQQLKHPDYALPYYSHALTLDEHNERAHEGILAVYRKTQAWEELSTALLTRADQVLGPTSARELRCEAATILVERLGNLEQAKELYTLILGEDPAHEAAQEGLSQILLHEEDYPALHELLLKRLDVQTGDARIQALLMLAQMEEGHLGDYPSALQRYDSVLEADENNEEALQGLERTAEQVGDHNALLRSLSAQVQGDVTPKQRITLWERIANIQLDEFKDLAAAATCYEHVLNIDPRHAGALSALCELYSELNMHEEAARMMTRLAELVDGVEDKIALWLQAANLLAHQIGEHGRAESLCERILALNSTHAEALALLAEVRTATGDLSRAVEAVEQLAQQAAPGAERAQQLLIAGEMAEKAGDQDAAVMRYKRALDEDPECVQAAEHLRHIYEERGDSHGAVEMLKRAANGTTGTLKRAQLLAELGEVQMEELDEDKDAELSFQEALSIEPTNTLASIGMGKLALRKGQDEKAAEHFDVAMARIDELEDDEAAAICALAGDAFARVNRTEESLAAYKRACELRPASLATHERHAEAVAKSGDAAGAAELYSDILRAFESRLDSRETARLLLARGENELDAGQAARAIATFKQAQGMSTDGKIAAALTRALEAAGKWHETIQLLQQRASNAASSDERFSLQVKAGDVFLEKLRDRNAAIQSYSIALEERPKDRNLLAKLMAVYSDAGDYPRLIEVILRIADLVDKPDQLAKYYQTAATIAHQELGRFDEAANYYEEALANLPIETGDAQFEGLCQCLSQNQDWDRLEQAYEARFERKREADASPAMLAGLLDARAELLRDRLGRAGEAIELFEEAQQLEPENQERSEMLRAIYTKEPKRYFERAVAAHRAVLEHNPYDGPTLHTLRRIYTSSKRPDESFCLCQALRVLQAADQEEEAFFKRYRLGGLARYRNHLDESLFSKYVQHSAQDPALTAIFAAMMPAITSLQCQTLESYGLTPDLLVVPEQDTTAMGRMLAYVGDTMSMRLPDVYHCPQDFGSLSFLYVAPPAIGIGQGALVDSPQQALAFIAARHLSYYRPGVFVRHLVPTGTGLRAWLMAAIRLVSPQSGVPANMEGQVNQCLDAIKDQLTGPQRDALRSMTQKLLETAPEVDMRKWMAAVDLTADRVGFVFGNDLKVARAIIEASSEDSASISRQDRDWQLMQYATSEDYFELRKRLGIALGS